MNVYSRWLVFAAVLACEVPAYELMKFQEIEKLNPKKMEILSWDRRFIWTPSRLNEDSAVYGWQFTLFQIDPELLRKVIPKKEIYKEDAVCGAGCSGGGYLILDDEYLVSIPCGFDDDDDLGLFYSEKEGQCGRITFQTGVRRFVTQKFYVSDSKKYWTLAFPEEKVKTRKPK